MVMAIIGTAAAIAMPRFAEAEIRWRVKGAAQRVVADLERAKATAMATSSPVIVSFEDTSYSMKASSDLTDAAGLGEVGLGSAPYGVEIVSADFGGEQSVIFSGSGVATSDGTLVLGRGAYRVSITFEALGGKAKPGEIYEDTRLVVKEVEGAKVLEGKR
jgi:Tfp pilus assembly protein FimT